MSLNPTKIEYLTHTWNVTPGCSKGCSYCWARRWARRNMYKCKPCREFVPHFHPERLKDVQRKKPARIGVSFTGELFDPHLDADHTASVLHAMRAAPQHTYVVLTKRPGWMCNWLRKGSPGGVQANWWLLTSVANQADADERIPEMLKLKAQGWPVVGVSYEPALGPVDFEPYLDDLVCDGCGKSFNYTGIHEDFSDGPSTPPDLCGHIRERAGIDWLIIGAQTGPGAKPIDLRWVARTVRQRREAGVPVFVKRNVNWPEKIEEYPT